MATGELFLFGEKVSSPVQSSVRGWLVDKLCGGDAALTVIASNGLSRCVYSADAHTEEAAAHMAALTVAHVWHGSKHSVAATTDGACFTFGDGNDGQLGLGHTDGFAEPQQVCGPLDLVRTVMVACGNTHTVALSDTGEVYCWGNNMVGQAGFAGSPSTEARFGKRGFQLVPRALRALADRRIVHVTCGHQFTLAVEDGGQVWSWGEGSAGQLGTGRVTSRAAPAVVLAADHEDAPFTRVAAGWAHAMARSKSGRVYVWGLNAHGQLGTGDTKSLFWPRLLDIRPVGGGALTSAAVIGAAGSYSAVVTKSGALFTWGTRGPWLAQHTEPFEAPEHLQHCLVPTEAAALAGQKVARIACCRRALLAFVPTSLRAIHPTTGPKTGGTELSLSCSGVWEVDTAVVCFEMAGAETHTVRATFVAPNQLRCEVPPLRMVEALSPRSEGGSEAPEEEEEEEGGTGGGSAASGAAARNAFFPVIVRVSMNGQDFSRERLSFTYYDTPRVMSMQPAAGPAAGGTKLALRVGGNFLPSENVRVAFLPPGATEGAAAASLPAAYDPNTGDITLTTPDAAALLPAGQRAVDARIWLSANGCDFSPVADFRFYDAAIDAVGPACIPANTPATVTVSGAGFFADGPAPLVHLTCARTAEVLGTCNARVDAPTSLTVHLPALLLGDAMAPDEGCGAGEAREAEADGEEKAAADEAYSGMPARAFSPLPLLQPREVQAAVALNGVDASLSFSLLVYVHPPIVPQSGGTLRVLARGGGALFPSRDCVVALSGVSTDTTLQYEWVADASGGVTLQCTVPPYVPPPKTEEEEKAEAEAAAAAAAATAAAAADKKAAKQVASDRAEQKAREDAEAAGKDRVARTVAVAVALDGRSFMPAGDCYYFAPPVFSGISPAAATPGTTISIRGIARNVLERAPPITVRLTPATGEPVHVRATIPAAPSAPVTPASSSAAGVEGGDAIAFEMPRLTGNGAVKVAVSLDGDSFVETAFEIKYKEK